MNISGIIKSAYLNNMTNAVQSKVDDKVASAAKTQSIQKADAVASATKTNGGDHYFEARV